ncbi:MAG: PAS domain S-box protein [Cytophagales bacterium]
MKYLPYKFVKKESVKILEDSVLNLESKVERASSLVKEIENGNYDSQIDLASEDENLKEDKLTSSLLSLRNKLKSYALEEKQRNWATEGLANFIDILRSKNDDLTNLTDKIISSLVKYINANQGALYLLNNDHGTEVYLEMTSCYAYNKKKFVNKKMKLGENLVGQSVLEKDIIYITDIPQDYIKITSGLGEALPANLLIVPLILDDEVFGVLEIASFNIFEKYQIEFVKKLGESIASTISSVKSNIKTIKLLEQSQVHAEEMRSQEEEMRQNMEELSATQEEMRRNGYELESRMRAIDHSGIASIEFDLNGVIITANDSFCKLMAYTVEELKGQHHSIFVSKVFKESLEYKQFWENLARGIAQPGEFERVNKNGESVYIQGCYSIVRNPDGTPNRVLKIATDITSSKLQLVKLQEQEEELRQNMEELNATQEEVQTILIEVQNKEAFMNNLIDSTSDSITAVDKNYVVIIANEQTRATYKAVGVDFGPGFNILNIFNEEQREVYKSYYDRALSGELFSINEEYNLMGQISHFAITYSPVKNGKGEVIAAVVFAKDITETISAKKEVEQLLHDAQSNAEELRLQEVEMRAFLSELTATQEENAKNLKKLEEKEIYMNNFLNATDDGIASVDKDLNFVTLNHKMIDFFTKLGRKIEVGMNVRDVLNPVNIEQQLAVYHKVLSGESFEATKQYGENIFNIKYCPIYNNKIEITGVSMFSRDITEFAQKESFINQRMDELSSISTFGSSILEKNTDIIFSVDSSFKLLNFNASLENLLAMSGIKPTVGFEILGVLKGKEEQIESKNLAKAFKGEYFENISTFEFGDSDILYLSKYYPNIDNKGLVTSVTVQMQNVTIFAKILNDQKLKNK